MHAYSTYMHALVRAYPIHSRAHMHSCAADRCTHSARPLPPYQRPHVHLSGG
jgi:hypothetical protein